MSAPGLPPVNTSPDPATLRPPGQVVILLAADIVSNAPELLELARAEGLVELERFLMAHRGIRSRRVVTHVDPQTLRRREAVAARSHYPPLRSLANYWRLDARSATDVESIRRTLERIPGIDVAFQETNVVPAGPSVSSNTYEANQDVLNAAPEGIDARAAWDKTNGMGQGVNVIDLECGWIIGHEDLPAFTLLEGDNDFLDDPANGDHGAAALGVVGGSNNNVGVVGVAPYLASLNVVSHYDAETGTYWHVANAIDAATKFLAPGDILYLEVQRFQDNKAFPVEIHLADLDAIRAASAQGIIVIEAAGNWTRNSLDDWMDPAGKHSLKVGAPLFNDSGAIMVGSSYYTVVNDPLGYQGHERYYRSNYGSRLDCYAWGERLYSAGYGTIAGASGGTNSYTNSFGETSGATAVIAGAAALVQSWYTSWCGTPLDPAQMRAILSNPATGTRQANVNSEPIGVMPDLKAILTCRRRFNQVLLCVLERLARSRQFDPREFAGFKAER